MIISQIVNNHSNSNSYLLELKNNDVVLIDVGDFDKQWFAEWLGKKKKKLVAVILTHEHSDHCCGINELHENYKFQLICSLACSINIGNSKQNLSYYISELETFEISIPEIYIVKDLEEITISETVFTFIETPGHSPGSLCVLTEKGIFTGDTLLNNKKTPLKFPHSDKQIFALSIEKLKTYLRKDLKVFPGHDKPFLHL